MPRAKALTDQGGNHSGWVVTCPGCNGSWHLFDARWSFNGDVERPTFAPSMLVNAETSAARNPDGSRKYPNAIRCHSFVTAGQIRFLDDCEHALAGKTVDLPDVDGGGP